VVHRRHRSRGLDVVTIANDRDLGGRGNVRPKAAKMLLLAPWYSMPGETIGASHLGHTGEYRWRRFMYIGGRA
jgi:hypothetical protein